MTAVGVALDPRPSMATHVVLGRATRAFIWACWATMVAGYLILVARFTRAYPFADELYYMTTSITPDWLWAQHGEHRIPLAKLVWMGVLKLTNYEFRIGAAISVLVVAAITYALIRAARNLRGSASISDAFLPLALLNFGPALNYLWWWQINHILPSVMALGLLLIVLKRNQLTPGQASIAGCCILLLCFSGPTALPYAFALGAWLGVCSLILFRSSSAAAGRRQALLPMCTVVLASACAAAYFVGYTINGTEAGITVQQPDLRAQLRATLQVASMGLGPAIRPHWKFAGIAVFSLLSVCAVILMVAWYTQPRERFRATALLLFVGAVASLFVLVGRSRAGLGDDYVLQGHYFHLAASALCVAYFVALLYASGAIQRIVHIGLLVVTCALWWQNLNFAVATGGFLQDGRAAFENDMERGVPAFILAERYLTFLGSPALDTAAQEWLSPQLGAMRQIGIPQFAHVAPDPAYRSVQLALASSEPANDTRTAAIKFDIGQPQFVYAIRVQGTYLDYTYRRTIFQLLWSGSNNQNRGDSVAVEINPYDGWAARYDRINKKVLTMWVNDVVDRFSIVPDTKPTEFTVTKVELLVPVGN